MTLQQARERAGLTQERAARLLDVGLKTIVRWEKGLSIPVATYFLEMCKLYDCDSMEIELRRTK